MSTQRARFELFTRLQSLGFTYDEAASLRRIEMTLQRWSEQECGDGNDHGSWAIERDEETGKPYRVHHHYLHGRGKDYVTRYAIADREAGALKRLAAIVAARNARNPDADPLIHYHQGDCRGCMLYLLKRSDIRPGEEIGSTYNRGLAVCC